MGTASDHAAAACAPDDPYGGGCRVLGWGGGREIASTKCATLTLVKCPLPSRVAPEPGGVERDQRPPRGRTYGVGDNCSWPPMRTHRSGRATGHAGTKDEMVAAAASFPQLPLLPVVVLVGGFNRLSGESSSGSMTPGTTTLHGPAGCVGKPIIGEEGIFQCQPSRDAAISRPSFCRCDHLHSSCDVYPLTQILGRGTARSLGSDSQGHVLRTFQRPPTAKTPGP